MALTVVQEYQAPVGDAFMKEFTVTFDSSYPTGGEALAPSDFFAHEIVAIISINVIAPLFGEKVVRWDPANKKLTIGVEGAAVFVQAGSASDQSAVKARILALVR